MIQNNLNKRLHDFGFVDHYSDKCTHFRLNIFVSQQSTADLAGHSDLPIPVKLLIPQPVCASPFKFNQRPCVSCSPPPPSPPPRSHPPLLPRLLHLPGRYVCAHHVRDAADLG